VGAGESQRHQVEELPVISTVVVEHRAQRVRCPGCGECARAHLPAEIASSAFGPRFEAAVAVLSSRNRVSRRDVVELVEELFGARISAGTVDAILTRTSQALEDPYEQLLSCVRSSESLNMDETGWRLKGAQRALWACSLPATRSFMSRLTVTRITPKSCSPGMRGSSPPIAGGTITICHSPGGKSADHTYAETSRRMLKD